MDVFPVSSWVEAFDGIWRWPLGTVSAGAVVLWLGVVVWWQKIYRLRASPGTWLVASAQFPVGIWAWDAVLGEPGQPLRFYVTLFFFTIPGWVLYRATHMELRRNQERRDAEADRLVAEPGARFALYLRSFGTTGSLASQPYVFDTHNDDPPEHFDLEQVVRIALGAKVPLVAAGRPDDLRGGAGRLVIPTDEWQSIVAKLARQAELVLMVPSANAGTLWEMRWLFAHRRFEGTVFLMPEFQNDDGVQRTMKMHLGKPLSWRFNSEDHFRDHAADWSAAAEAAAGEGIRLPPYQHEGAMFTLDEDGTLKKLVRLDLVNTSRKISRVREGLTELTDTTAESAPLPTGEVVFRLKMLRHVLGTLSWVWMGAGIFGTFTYFLATSPGLFWKVMAVFSAGATVIWLFAGASELHRGGDFAIGPEGITILPETRLPWSGIDTVRLMSTPNGWFLIVQPTPEGLCPGHLWNDEVDALVVASLRRVKADERKVVAALNRHSGGRFVEDDDLPAVSERPAAFDVREASWRPGRLVVRTDLAPRVYGYLFYFVTGLVMVGGWLLWVTTITGFWHLLGLPLLLGLFGIMELGPGELHGQKLQFDASGITHWVDCDTPPAHHHWPQVETVEITSSDVSVRLCSGDGISLTATTSKAVQSKIRGYAADRYRES